MKKMFSYLDFILEKEGPKTMNLHYSEKFRNLLEKMKDNQFANLLLKAESSNQISDIYTLIDLTDKNDIISCIQVNRILRSGTEYVRQPYPEEPNYYFLRPQITTDMNNEFWKNGRTEMSIGKWVRRVVVELYKSTLTDSQLEQFVNLYKSTYDKINLSKERFQLVEGEEIRKWYLENNYQSIKGQLGSSCMRYPKCQSYFDIYVKNPGVCKLLIMKSEDNPEKIVGRALVWKLFREKSKVESDYYMDRVYTISDSDRLLFEQWAKEKRMAHQGKDYKTMYVKLDSGDFNRYPYMDTFLCYNDQNLLLTNDEDKWPGQGYVKINNTDGTFTPDDSVWSEWHGDYIPSDEATYCEDIRDYMRDTEAIFLEYKNIFVSPDADIVYSNFLDENFYSEDCVKSEIMDDYLYKNSSVLIKVIIDSSGEEDYCVKPRTDLYVKVGDNYFYRKNYIKDPYSGEFHFLDEKEGSSVMTWGDNLYHRILEDIIPENLRDLDPNTIRDVVINQVKEMVLKNNYNKESVCKEISESENFKKRIRGVYWGFHKNDIPEAEDLVPLIVIFKLKNLSKNVSASLMGQSFDESINLISDEDLKRKVRVYREYSFLRVVLSLANDISVESFGSELYKRFTFLSL